VGLTLNIQASAGARAVLGRQALPRMLLRRGARAALRAQGMSGGELSLTLLDDAEIAALNKHYLRHEGPTDVLAFALYRAPEPVLGDIYLGVARAQEEALARGIPLEHELLRLTVHATLHVLGHDHPAGAGRTRSRMWRLQERILDEVLAT